MSVFLRKDAKDGTYSYDFQLGGRRFSGSTGETTLRAARQVEKARRAEAAAEISAESSLFSKDMVLSAATARYWQEVGQHHKNADNTMRSLTWLLEHFGEAKKLKELTDGDIAAMVAKRRGEFVPSQRKPGKKYRKPEIRKRVSNATVNRTATQPMREVCLRARDVWGVRVGEINWPAHMLDESQERVREATPAEEAAIMEELPNGYADAVEFTFLTGCRRMEVIGLIWTRVDFFSRQFIVLGKGDKLRTIPMTKRTYEILWAQKGHHPEQVFTYLAQRTVKRGDDLIVKGQRYPMTESGLKTASRRAIARSGVKDFRFHDMRHTAATRVLRKSNLRVVQKLLGHSDVKTTTKYAHAMMDDVLNALEAASPTGNPTERLATKAKVK